MADGRDPRCRQALTLLEVLLVLSLLVILALVAWPALDRPMATHRLRQAAETVRTELARARNRAIATGETVRFLCTPGTNRCWIARGDDAESLPSELSGTVADSVVAPQDPSTVPGQAISLPEGTTFLTIETDGASDGTGDGAGGILFFPDGSSSTARVVLRNQHSRCIEVTLRGLTGLATVGEIFAAEASAAENELP